MPDDAALGEIESVLRACRDLGRLPDALIVSDPGVLMLCRRWLESVPLHLSTQTGTFNSESAKFWKSQGVARVILPREMSLPQIAALTRKAGMETEIFAHGAMCVSVSGRCLLGAYLANRHPNWGDCSQPCRLKYRIAACEEGGAEGKWLTVEEDRDLAGGTDSYILNSKDLNTLAILPRIAATGVASLKIEGRNKSSHYVAAVVKVYRDALDAFASDPESYRVRQWWTDELERLDHRPYTTGFYDGESRLQEPGGSEARSGLRVVGMVKGLLAGGQAVVDVKNPFSAGDTVSVLPVKTGSDPFSLRVTSISDMGGNPVERAATNRFVVISGDTLLRIGDLLRRQESSVVQGPSLHP
jgi:putative protease